ncbi:MAG: flavin reductase family protein, partial [Paracoccaceae bacterium]
MPDTAYLGPAPAPAAFRAAMRGFVGACSLITTGTGTEATGLVVTSGISLTAEPPMILACINRTSSSWPVLKATGAFGWSALGASHQPVAERFSGMGGLKGHERYEGGDWITGTTGARHLADAPLAFDCTVEEMIDRGTHSIVIGRVQTILTNPGKGALLYWNAAYHP